MLGNTLVTIQTGEAGKQVNRLYVTDGADIAKEFYLALLVDRATGRVAFVVSTERSEEHTSELQSLMRISYAVFCLKTKIETFCHPHSLSFPTTHYHLSCLQSPLPTMYTTTITDYTIASA